MPEHTDPEIEAATRRWMWGGVVLMALFVVAFPLYRIYEPGTRAESRQQQLEALAAEGRNLYLDNCAACHGDRGQGAHAPDLYSKQFLDNVTQDQIDSIIAHGIPGSQMVAWSLDFDGPMTSEQIRAISTYLESLRPTAPDRPDWRQPEGEPSSDDGSSDSTATTTPASEEAVIVHIIASDFAFESDLTTFQVGVPYRFVVSNVGVVVHELMIVPPIEPGAVDMETMDELALVVIEPEDLAAGAEASADYTFTEEDVGQQLEMACHVEGHYEAGMHLPITVTD
jgi:mono/diheme cytochrome c family protein/uncharacterized cupredoxin-like copper-binding protein